MYFKTNENRWGVIKSTPPGAQYDDHFEQQSLGLIINLSIDSLDPSINAQMEVVRDISKIVHLCGTLVSDFPDYNGSQIRIDCIEIAE